MARGGWHKEEGEGITSRAPQGTRWDQADVQECKEASEEEEKPECFLWGGWQKSRLLSVIELRSSNILSNTTISNFTAHTTGCCNYYTLWIWIILCRAFASTRSNYYVSVIGPILVENCHHSRSVPKWYLASCTKALYCQTLCLHSFIWLLLFRQLTNELLLPPPPATKVCTICYSKSKDFMSWLPRGSKKSEELDYVYQAVLLFWYGYRRGVRFLVLSVNSDSIAKCLLAGVCNLSVHNWWPLMTALVSCDIIDTTEHSSMMLLGTSLVYWKQCLSRMWSQWTP